MMTRSVIPQSFGWGDVKAAGKKNGIRGFIYAFLVFAFLAVGNLVFMSHKN